MKSERSDMYTVQRMEIKRLPSEFTHEWHGFDFKLIERIGNLAWYETRYIGGTKLKGYVVIKIRIRRGGKLPSGTVLLDYEEFPPESSFGKSGSFFLPTSREIAESEFKRLVAEAKKSLRTQN